MPRSPAVPGASGRAIAARYVAEGGARLHCRCSLRGRPTCGRGARRGGAWMCARCDRASLDRGLRGVHRGTRGARHPCEQCCDLRPRADRGHHRAELRPGLRRECERPALHAAGGGPADDRGEPARGDHQHGLPGRATRRGAGQRLLREQGGGDQPHPVGRAQPHRPWNSA